MSQGFTKTDAIIGVGVDNQVAVWSGTAALDGSTSLTYDGTDLLLGSGIRARMLSQNRFRYLNSMVKVYGTANQVIPTGTNTTLTWNSEVFDTDTLHSTAANTGRLTAAIAGKYLVGGEVQWGISALGTYRQGTIYLNGSVVAALGTIGPNAGGTPIQTGSMIIAMAATDYVELVVIHDAGVDQDILKGIEASSTFWMAYLGE